MKIWRFNFCLAVCDSSADTKQNPFIDARQSDEFFS